MGMVQDAIKRVYAEFADVPRPRAIDGCPHCIEAKEVGSLLETPLRQISSAHLASYASSAFLTVGGVSDYQYFLPRILEISANDDSWWPDIEVTARAIRSCSPDSWPSRRKDALGFLLGAVIGDAVESGAYDRLDPWICATARMGFDVAPHLEQVAKVPAAVLAYFEDNASCLPQGKLCNAFWELPDQSHDEIVVWFNSEKIRKIVFDAYGYVSKPARA